MNEQVCNRCVMDTTDMNIRFDENGICDHCSDFFNLIESTLNYGLGHHEFLVKKIEKIKARSQANDFDCIIG